MPNITALFLTVAAFGSPGSLPADKAPTVRGATADPSFIVHARPTTWLTGICPNDARPSDVTVTDRRGRQFRTRANGQRWIDREGVTVAVRRGDRVTTYLRGANRGFVAAWCEAD